MKHVSLFLGVSLALSPALLCQEVRSGNSQSVSALASQPTVSAFDVSRACEAAQHYTSETDQFISGLQRFCEGLTTTKFAFWASNVRIPTPDMIRSAQIANVRDSILLSAAVATLSDSLAVTFGGLAAASAAMEASAEVLSTLSPSLVPTPSVALWALTEVAVEKGQEAVQTWGVMRFTKVICGSDNLVFAALLPETCAALHTMSVDQFKPSMVLVRKAIEQDARTLPAALVEQVLSAKASSIDPGKWDVGFTTLLLARLAVPVLRGRPLHEALRKAFSRIPAIAGRELSCTSHPFATGVYEAGALALTAFQPNGTFSLASVDTQLQARAMLLALAVNSSYGEAWPADSSCALPPNGLGVRFANPELVLTAAERIAPVASNLIAAEHAVRDLSGRTSYEDRLASGRKLIVTSIDLLGNGFVAANRAPPRWTEELTGVYENLVDHIQGGDYAGAVLAISGQLAQLSSNGMTFSLPRNVSRVVAFAADVATAQNTQAVSAALASLVSGGGGYLRKRSPDVHEYVSVNTYLGALLGGEVAESQTRFFGGPYLPLGVEIGLHHRMHGIRAVLLQFLDLGALASWRLRSGGDSINSAPEVGISRVFSPGLFVIFPLSTSPFSVGIGAEYAPSLRTLQSTMSAGAASQPVSAWRFGAFFGVDVPIFP
jgi:hypothetical protein